jgi:integrase
MGKRGPNEGSIHKRKDGRWVGVINLGFQDGKRRRKYIYGDTRGAVQGRFTAALRTHQQHLPVVGERETTADFLNRWLEESVKPTVRPPTYRSYEQMVRLHIVPDLGRIPLARLSPRDIQGLINYKLTTELSPRTVQYIHAVLRHALAQALRWGLVARNAAALVDAPRVQRPEVTPFNPEQADIFLNAAKGDRLEALFSVALAVGLRQGEALGLRWEDLDLDKGDLRVRVALQRVGGKLEFVEPKTARSRRTIALPDLIVASLRAHRARQLREKLVAGSRWQETGVVFTTAIGTPLDGRNVTKNFQKLVVKAGLPLIRFHDLRHTAASLLLAQEIHPRVVMEILGHSQIKLTMDTYSHVIPALQREAASKIDVVLRRSLS